MILLDSFAYAMPLLLPPSKTLDIEDTSNGVYIGIDLIFGRKIHWSVTKSPSSHILIVGPSGSGKSVSVSVIVSRLSTKFGAPITVFDIKNEYESYMKLFLGRTFNVWDVTANYIPLCTCGDEVGAKYDAQLFVNTINTIFKMPAYVREQLLDVVTKLCRQCDETILGEAIPSYWLLEDYESLDAVLNVFKVYSTTADVLEMMLNKDIIIDLHKIFLLDKKASATIILYIMKQLLRRSAASFGGGINRIVVLDELWHLTHYAIDEFINVLVRYGRGFGIAIAMATQSIDDLNPYANSIVENCGMFMALSSASQSYWLKLAKYLNLSRKGVENAMKFSGQGTGVLRLYPLEKPLYVYVDPLSI